jgi:hypothetical protein
MYKGVNGVAADKSRRHSNRSIKNLFPALSDREEVPDDLSRMLITLPFLVRLLRKPDRFPAPGWIVRRRFEAYHGLLHHKRLNELANGLFAWRDRFVKIACPMDWKGL